MVCSRVIIRHRNGPEWPFQEVWHGRYRQGCCRHRRRTRDRAGHRAGARSKRRGRGPRRHRSRQRSGGRRRGLGHGPAVDGRRPGRHRPGVGRRHGARGPRPVRSHRYTGQQRGHHRRRGLGGTRCHHRGRLGPDIRHKRKGCREGHQRRDAPHEGEAVRQDREHRLNRRKAGGLDQQLALRCLESGGDQRHPVDGPRAGHFRYQRERHLPRAPVDPHAREDRRPAESPAGKHGRPFTEGAVRHKRQGAGPPWAESRPRRTSATRWRSSRQTMRRTSRARP